MTTTGEGTSSGKKKLEKLKHSEVSIETSCVLPFLRLKYLPEILEKKNPWKWRLTINKYRLKVLRSWWKKITTWCTRLLNKCSPYLDLSSNQNQRLVGKETKRLSYAMMRKVKTMAMKNTRKATARKRSLLPREILLINMVSAWWHTKI